MRGPKMGPRPPDFDEEFIRRSPTFFKWTSLEAGEKLRYACRDFIKGHGDAEERLMRRIMTIRRNHLQFNAVMKKARKPRRKPEGSDKVRRPPLKFTDQQFENEMDVAAVEATRSYRTWVGLPDGVELVYKQKYVYVKGKDGHDWLLRKKLWTVMRYRRENKTSLQKLQNAGELLPQKPAPRQGRRADSPEHTLPLQVGGGGHENADMDILCDSAADTDTL